MLPDDEHNRTLIRNVHPQDWVNPEPSGKYNLVVIGAGPAGLVAASVAAALGAKVALIERHLMGGDCLNVGCVPSKGMIRASRVFGEMRHANAFGVEIPKEVKIDFAAVMERVRKIRAQISPTDSAERYRKLGVDVYIGEGQFIGPDIVEVKGRQLSFSNAVICTGTRAAVPSISGLADVGYLTNETVFSLTKLPKRLAVIGAGPIGCELGQSFARFGSQVKIVATHHGILPREDRDATEIILDSMYRDGIELLCCAKELTIKKTDDGKRLTLDSHGQHHQITVDEILVAAGRVPNTEGLNLEKAVVTYDTKTGIRVNHRLETTNPKIYAAGDVCFPFKFTHAADALAQIVIQNALFPHPFGLGRASTDHLIIPWCTYTSPEIAHVGLYESDAKTKGIEVETFTYPLAEVDRALLDGETEGFARVHVKRGTDEIIGATVVAGHAGDLISMFTLAMKAKVGLATIGATIYPYPTQAEVIKRVATAWRKTILTEGKKKILRKLFQWTR
jgi:pyruvate/2-oxoglutarate dehydrogenase complex dihydrolipoamide dehydrogenase (E3) component